jgi:hypothetical protein
VISSKRTAWQRQRPACFYLEFEKSQPTLGQVSGLVADYISAQRHEAESHALNLSSAQIRLLQGFFRKDVLDTTRLLVLGVTRGENPPFYSLLREMGFKSLPDFSQMAAITFGDVVVRHQPVTTGLLFHELVHVEQYRQLGIRRFAELYVRGFFTGGGYDGIPLELKAYQLGERFERSPQTPFSVELDVSAWIRDGRF